jgi:hypothetical protein
MMKQAFYPQIKYKFMPRKVKKPSSKKRRFPGYPLYPAHEDIYARQKEETEIDPENPSVKKAPNEKPDHKNEKDFEEDVSGGDLDVPGAELDDALENIGTEDEENNHYSLGGDNHHSQEEGIWE